MIFSLDRDRVVRNANSFVLFPPPRGGFSAENRMSVIKAKVPAAIVTGVIGLLGGVALGIAIMGYVDHRWGPEAAANPGGEAGVVAPETNSKAGMPGMPGMGGGKAGGMPGAGAGGAKGGAPKGPNPKNQFTQLVNKLDALTRKPLTVQLTPDQKKQVAELLAGIDDKEELTEDDAKAKLDALLKILEGDKATFSAAGFNWPGTPPPPGAFGGQAPKNPFNGEDNAAKLKELRETLGK